MANEFATAIVKFLADDSQLKKSNAEIVAAAEVTAKKVVAASSGTSSAFAASNIEATKLKKEFEAWIAPIRASQDATKGIGDELQKTNKHAENVGGGLGKMKEMGKQAFEIFAGISLASMFQEGLVALKDFLTESVKLGLEAQVQEDAFTKMASFVGISGDVLVEQMQRAAHGLLNTSDVMISASKAMSKGIGQDQLVALMKVAEAQSKLTGATVAQAYNDITEAIANQMPRALKQYGIILDLDKVQTLYAEKLGVTKDQLTEFGKTQAIAEAVIEKTKGTVAALSGGIETHARTLERASAQWKQFKEDLGKAIVDSGFEALAWFQEISNSFASSETQAKMWNNTLAEIWGGETEEISVFGESLNEIKAVFVGLGISAMESLKPIGKVLVDVLIVSVKTLVGVVLVAAVVLAGAFALIAPPIAFIASLIDDIAHLRIPNLEKAAIASKDAWDKASAGAMQAAKGLADLATGTHTVTEAEKELTVVKKEQGELFKKTAQDIATELKNRIDAVSALATEEAKQASNAINFNKEVLNINRKVAESEAAFNGKLADDLEGFQEQRRASIVQTSNLAISEAKRMYEVNKQTLQVQIDASAGEEKRKLTEQAGLIDKQYNTQVKEESQKTTMELMANDALVLQEKRQNAAAAQQLANAEAAYLSAIGKQTLDEEISRLREVAGNRDQSIQTRRDADVAALNMIRKLEKDSFDLATAQGKTTVLDAVVNAGKIAASWKAGTQQRLDAEKQFAGEVKRLWDGLVSAGRSLEDMAIENLQKMGKAINTSSIADELGKIRDKARDLNGVWQQGGSLTKDQIDLVRKWGAENANLTKMGVNQYQALAASTKQLNRDVMGIATTTSDAVGSMQQIGIAVGGAATGMEAMSQAVFTAAAAGTKYDVALSTTGNSMLGFGKIMYDTQQGVMGETAAMNEWMKPIQAVADFSQDVAVGQMAMANALKEGGKGAAAAGADFKALKGLYQEGGISLQAYSAVLTETRNSMLSGKDGAAAAAGAIDALNAAYDKGTVNAAEYLAELKLLQSAQAKGGDSGLVSQYTKGYEKVLSETDTFFDNLKSKIQSGNSNIADTVYQYFTNQVIEKLNTEAARS